MTSRTVQSPTNVWSPRTRGRGLPTARSCCGRGARSSLISRKLPPLVSFIRPSLSPTIYLTYIPCLLSYDPLAPRSCRAPDDKTITPEYPTTQLRPFPNSNTFLPFDSPEPCTDLLYTDTDRPSYKRIVTTAETSAWVLFGPDVLEMKPIIWHCLYC